MSICQTCGHKASTSKPSSIEFRRKVHNIGTLQEFTDSKDYLVSFVKSRYKNKECVSEFLKELDDRIDMDIEYLKIWLLSYWDKAGPESKGMLLGNSQRPDPETPLYEFVRLNYYSANCELSESFHDFYDNYCMNIDNPLNRNHVSRALNAFGIKTIMKKVKINGEPKCTIWLDISKEELADAFRRNGYPA